MLHLGELLTYFDYQHVLLTMTQVMVPFEFEEVTSGSNYRCRTESPAAIN